MTDSKKCGRVAKGMFHTVPILLVGSMAMSLNLTGHVETNVVKDTDKPKNSHENLRAAVRNAMSSQSSQFYNGTQGDTVPARAGQNETYRLAALPTTYRVRSGDTVSAIAARFGLSTASVLALNGLGWKSLIFPGQELMLTKATSSTPLVDTSDPSTTKQHERYTILRGDTISGVAARFGVTTASVLNANGLGWSSIIYPGQSVLIPRQSAAAPALDQGQDQGTVELAPVVEVTPMPSTRTTYLIRSGDTVTGIAAKFGVSIQAVLDANDLNRSSIIYSGRTLVIPTTGIIPAGVGGVVVPLTDEMKSNAETIIAVGRSLGVDEYGIVIALAAAAQESTLRNLNYGDRDSLGLFQQRPSTGWGTPAEVTDPVYASRLFYGGPAGPNRGITDGLLDIRGWQNMTVTEAAQAVQRSAYPNAYAKWETSARSWLDQLT